MPSLRYRFRITKVGTIKYFRDNVREVRACCDRKARAASEKSFTLRQQAPLEITRRDRSVIACSRHVYMGVVLRAHSVRGEPTHSTKHQTRGCNRPMPLYPPMTPGLTLHI